MDWQRKEMYENMILLSFLYNPENRGPFLTKAYTQSGRTDYSLTMKGNFCLLIVPNKAATIEVLNIVDEDPSHTRHGQRFCQNKRSRTNDKSGKNVRPKTIKEFCMNFRDLNP